MKKTLYTLLSALLLLSVVFVGGCKDKTTDPVVVDTTIPNDVFPLKAGNRFDYTGYFTTQDTETPLSGNTNTYYSTSWTLGSPVTKLSDIFGVAYGGLVSSNNGGRTTASLILDTTLIGPPLTPPGVTFKKFTPIFAYYDTATADYYYMTNLGLFFRGSKINKSATDTTRRSDSLRFIKLASPKAGIGGTFTSFQQSYISYSNPSAPTTIDLTITGKWESKVNVTVNDSTYSTYYLVISRVAKVGTTVVSSGVTAKLWLAKGIGPVKMLLIGDAETPGNFRELKKKNFPNP